MSWAWRSIVAGLCGAIAHSLLMYIKSRSGLLPSFQLYESPQIVLGHAPWYNISALFNSVKGIEAGLGQSSR